MNNNAHSNKTMLRFQVRQSFHKRYLLQIELTTCKWTDSNPQSAEYTLENSHFVVILRVRLG